MDFRFCFARALFPMCLAACLACALSTSARADGRYFEVSYPPSTEPARLQLGVTYTLWVPDGVGRLRGVIVHQHGCGAPGGRGGARGGGPRKGADESFRRALHDLSPKCGHEELEQAPWCLWGHSGGGY